MGDRTRVDDLAALFFFLVAAEDERLMLAGRQAGDVLDAAGRLLGYTDDAMAAVRGFVRAGHERT